MTIYKIEVDATDPAFMIRVNLDGREFDLTLDWNGRDERWYLSISDAEGVPIRTSIKVVPRWFLLQRVVDDRCPPGDLIVYDPSGNDAPITRLDLGSRAFLYYYDAAELGA